MRLTRVIRDGQLKKSRCFGRITRYKIARQIFTNRQRIQNWGRRNSETGFEWFSVEG